MKCETVKPLLEDYVDGLLIGDEPAQVERHLENCPECARKVAGLNALLHNAKNLPRVVLPQRDLWPAISSQIDNPQKQRIVKLNFFAKTALAAAFLAVLAAGLLTFARVRLLDQNVAITDAPASLQQQMVAAEAEYQRARRELVAAMDKLPHRLAPETRTVIDQNLAIIDGAILEIRGSLEKDPENVFLFEMLVAEQDRSLHLLGIEEAIVSNTW